MYVRKYIASIALLIAVSAPMAVQACAEDPDPTATSIPVEARAATHTPAPEPTDTPAPVPTDTPVPVPTDTPVPAPTNTPVPIPTNTPVPEPTDTPTPTNPPEPEPTNTPIPEPTNTPIPEPTNTPIPEPTNTPVPTPTTAPEPTRMPVETALTVDEYLEVCSTVVAPAAATGVPLEITNGELSEMIGNYHVVFSELNPPAEIEDWHNLQLDIWMAMREALDRQPTDEPVNPIVLLEPVFANIEALFSLQISQDLMDRLNAAGCTGNVVDLEGMTTEEPPAEETQPSAGSPAEVLAEVEAFAAGCAVFGELAAVPQAGSTWGETSEGLGTIIELLGAMEPPETLLDWRTAQLTLLEAVKEIADAEPANDPLDQTKLFALLPEIQAVEAALGELAADVAGILFGAGCIGE